MNKRQLIEILPRPRNRLEFLLGGAYPDFLVTEHHFPGNDHHRLVAVGSEFQDGEEAAFAARRLMRVEHTYDLRTYVVPAYQWGG